MIEQMHRSQSEYEDRTEIAFRSGAGRIYVTSPSFGVDLSVDYVRGEFSMNHEYERFHAGLPLEYRGRILREVRHRLLLDFSLPALNLILPTKTSPSGLYEEIDPSAPTYIIDKQKPPPPSSPLWLPTGTWRCDYCTTPQQPDLLQCRNCGAARPWA